MKLKIWHHAIGGCIVGLIMAILGYPFTTVEYWLALSFYCMVVIPLTI